MLFIGKGRRGLTETQLKLSQRVSRGVEVIKIVKIKNRGAIEASELRSQLGLGCPRPDLPSAGKGKTFWMRATANILGKKFSQRAASPSAEQVVSFEGEDIKFDSLVKIVVLL